MTNIIVAAGLALAVLGSAGCAGLKVVNPNEKKNPGAKQLDFSGGQLRLVDTYTCNLSSMGNHFSAMGKSEDEARKEVVARCRDKSVLSFCKPENASCVKN